MTTIDPEETYFEKYQDRGLDLDFYPHFLTEDQSEDLINYIEKSVVWRQTKLTPGKRANQTYGDEGFTYSVNFRGKSYERKAVTWTRTLAKIRDHVQEATNEKYNICVIQRYPSGKVGIAPHRDREMTEGTTICGLSLGEVRTLTMTTFRRDVSKFKYELKLLNGSVYVFNPPTNDHWLHSIEKDDTILPRYSLTFRNYMS